MKKIFDKLFENLLTYSKKKFYYYFLIFIVLLKLLRLMLALSKGQLRSQEQQQLHTQIKFQYITSKRKNRDKCNNKHKSKNKNTLHNTFAWTFFASKNKLLDNRDSAKQTLNLTNLGKCALIKSYKHENDNHKAQLAAALQYISQHSCTLIYM